MQQNVLDVTLATTIYETTQARLCELEHRFQNTFLEGVVPEAKDETDTNWIFVLEENLDQIISKNLIGDFDNQSESNLVNQSNVLEVLHNSTIANWYDPYFTIGTLLLKIGNRIEQKFDSDSGYIEFIRNNDIKSLEYQSDNLEHRYSKLREYKEQNGIISPAERSFMVDEEYDLLLAKDLHIIGSCLKKQAEKQFWNNEPEVGQYITYEVDVEGVKDIPNAPSYTIVAKVVDKISRNRSLSNVDPDITFTDSKTHTLNEYEINVISYDSEILEYFPKHYLVTCDANETEILRNVDEPRITLYNDNPLPLDK